MHAHNYVFSFSASHHLTIIHIIVRLGIRSALRCDRGRKSIIKIKRYRRRMGTSEKSYAWEQDGRREREREREIEQGKKRITDTFRPLSTATRDRLVIYTSGHDQISAKDLDVTCCQRFSVFFTCSCLPFLLLSALRRYLFFSIVSSFSFFPLTFYPFSSYRAKRYINLFSVRIIPFAVCVHGNTERNFHR